MIINNYILYLDTVIDKPLQGGKSSDHDDTGTKTSPEAAKAKGVDGLAEGGAGGLVQVGDQGVRGVGHDGAEHTGDVTGGECNHELLRLGALGPGLGDHVLVEGLHGALEASELHHGVGDLSAPQGNQGLVEAIDSFLAEDLGEGASQGGGEGADGRGLDPHLDNTFGMSRVLYIMILCARHLEIFWLRQQIDQTYIYMVRKQESDKVKKICQSSAVG